MQRQEASPDEVRVVDEGRRMRLIWADGSIDDLTARDLRLHSRDARTRRDHLDSAGAAGVSTPGISDEDISILEVMPVGRYAVNLRFSDGFDRGIYPWGFLRKIAAGTLGTDFGH